jgi:hypothetical protein
MLTRRNIQPAIVPGTIPCLPNPKDVGSQLILC